MKQLDKLEEAKKYIHKHWKLSSGKKIAEMTKRYYSTPPL